MSLILKRVCRCAAVFTLIALGTALQSQTTERPIVFVPGIVRSVLADATDEII